VLFVDGQCFDYGPEAAALVEGICAQHHLTVDPALLQSDAAMELLADLFNQGSLDFDPTN